MNTVRLKLIKDCILDKNFNVIPDTENICLTISCDGCSAVLGYVETEDDVKEIIDGKNIIANMRNMLSDCEMDIFEPLMGVGKKYYFYGEEFEVMKEHEMNIDISKNTIRIECDETGDELILNLATNLDGMSVLNKIRLKYDCDELFYTHTFDIEDYLLQNYENYFEYTGSEEERY